MFDIWPGSFDVDKKSDAIALVLPFESEEEARKYLDDKISSRKAEWEGKGFRVWLAWKKVGEFIALISTLKSSQ